MYQNNDTDWINHCTMMEVEGTRGRPRKTRWDGSKEDMERFGLSQEDAHCTVLEKMEKEN